MDTDSAKRALKDATALGYTSTGVNFTGGEPFLPGSNLPDMVELAHSLNLTVRINTNGWWGCQRNIMIGSLQFPSSMDVIGWLLDMKVTGLALSFDQRYKSNPGLWEPVVSIIRECERQGMLYQIVATGVSPEEMLEALNRLKVVERIHPKYMIPVPMDMIDLGGAAGSLDDTLETKACPCGGRKGFYRPELLHISPAGGVRTCLYAPGSEWLGNINTQTLIQIADGFENNCVVEAFRSFTIDQLIEKYLPLNNSNVYQLPKHPCAIAACIARAIEEYDRFKKIQGRKPLTEDLRKIHANIEKHYNL